MKWMAASLLLLAAPAGALNEGLQCVPYARALSGVIIYGDAHSWWGQAEGKYDRGNDPRVGAVLAFPPYGNMRLGHVAAVRRLIDNRTIVISHANWSTIDGTRGHIEEDVRAVDVSEANDWSRVRVWYTPNEALGSTEWPVHGFIYPKQPRSDDVAQKAVAMLLKGRLVPTLSKTPPVRMAEAGRAKFDLAHNLLKDIDRKAIAESKSAVVSVKATQLASIEKLIARLPKR